MSAEVADALSDGTAVVALESTLLSHGLPPGRNLDVARRLEQVVRDAGAVPATIAVLDGTALVGLSPAQLERICAPGADLAKLSVRDLGPTIARGRSGATTVASTSVLAHAAGIGVFATGGLGGVHLPVPGSTVTWDVSADLGALERTPVLVVCSGMKSILDIAATLEVLETNSVPVLGYGVDEFPAFYLRSSGLPVPHRVDDPRQVAAAVSAHRHFADSGVLLANPIPAEAEMDAGLHDRLLAEGLDLVKARNVHGSDVTPVLLEHFHTASGGVSLDANEALVLANAALAAQVAVELAS
ncbi:pseudouridine-5'-phosphate glycosidase [Saccharomonospora sp. NPDC046836]|uniref:pseudouridine-5'-phosphate glycosidase n=1 Tax=Saccharomonospora sp. NPDC046836 TaxID=3156921 RepID=UPI0033F6D029